MPDIQVAPQTPMPDRNQNVPSTWMECMRQGKFEEAWKFSDAALASGINRDHNLPRHFQNIWNGTPLNGKRVLIRCYHGLGDTIQFIRYAPLVKQIAREVMVWAQPALMELLGTADGIDQLIPLHEGTPEADYDVDTEVMELPYVFRSTMDTIPKTLPYLHVDKLNVLQPSGKLTVGLVWQAGDWDRSRCIPFELLEPLAEIGHVELLILQAGAVAAGWREGFGTNPGEFDLFNYARVIKGLDLLITVDSMPAHLGGALHVPVWTLLHAGADWRWMEGTTSSPWYPSMKLFRQENEGDWQWVIQQVIVQLGQLAQDHGANHV